MVCKYFGAILPSTSMTAKLKAISLFTFRSRLFVPGETNVIVAKKTINYMASLSALMIAM